MIPSIKKSHPQSHCWMIRGLGSTIHESLPLYHFHRPEQISSIISGEVWCFCNIVFNSFNEESQISLASSCWQIHTCLKACSGWQHLRQCGLSLSFQFLPNVIHIYKRSVWLSNVVEYGSHFHSLTLFLLSIPLVDNSQLEFFLCQYLFIMDVAMASCIFSSGSLVILVLLE